MYAPLQETNIAIFKCNDSIGNSESKIAEINGLGDAGKIPLDFIKIAPIMRALMDDKYDMEHLWNQGGKVWKYEYKYRRGGKTFCALCAKGNCIDFMIILDKDERLKFGADKENYSKYIQEFYNNAQTSLFNDFIELLSIKILFLS